MGARPACALVHASIVVNEKTGAVLEAHHADAHAHPASLTKLMTLYITFERLESHKLTLATPLRVSRHAAAQEPMKLWLRPGSHITVRTAILGIVTLSANDAAVVLAENIGGSEPRFTALMNHTAQQLGMTRTRFYNASGLPNYRQWTTARDMSILARAIIDQYPGYYHFFNVRSFRFHGHTVYGHDHVLNLFAGADGMKTGYIRSSGYNLVTSAVRDDRRLVGVVLGGTTAYRRDRTMVALLTRAFASRGTPILAAHAEEPQASPMPRKASIKLVSDDTEQTSLDPAEEHRWVVEIGGNFSSEPSVRRVLGSAARSAPGLRLRSRELVVKLRGRHYRARFAHLTEETAMRACRRLDRKGFTCRYFSVGLPAEDRASLSAAAASAGSE